MQLKFYSSTFRTGQNALKQGGKKTRTLLKICIQCGNTIFRPLFMHALHNTYTYTVCAVSARIGIFERRAFMNTQSEENNETKMKHNVKNILHIYLWDFFHSSFCNNTRRIRSRWCVWYAHDVNNYTHTLICSFILFFLAHRYIIQKLKCLMHAIKCVYHK